MQMVWVMGYNKAKNGGFIGENPYNPDTQPHSYQQWNEGFLAGFEVYEQEFVYDEHS